MPKKTKLKLRRSQDGVYGISPATQILGDLRKLNSMSRRMWREQFRLSKRWAKFAKEVSILMAVAQTPQPTLRSAKLATKTSVKILRLISSVNILISSQEMKG